jgi:hypothetical protein
MADKGIKNVIIKKDLLGKVTSSNERVARFRIITEDKNRKSSWSQIFMVDSEAIVVGQGDVNIIGNTISVTWSSSQTLVQISYDIFVGFDGLEPSYLGTSSSQTYSFLKTGTQSVRAVVQISSINPVLTPSLDVYDSGIVSLV